MTSREIAVGAVALVMGALLVTAGLLIHRHLVPTPSASTADAGAPSDPLPIAPLDPQRYDDEDDGGKAGKDASAPAPAPVSPPSLAKPAVVADAAAPTKEKEKDASVPGVRAENLMIHPVTNEHLCVDLSSHGHGLQLFTCHGRKNQRWTVDEDTGGLIRLENGSGECVRVGAREAGETSLTLGACDARSARFRHADDRRFREISTGLCMAAEKIDVHGKLVLSTCDASNTQQTWGLGR